jgi:hypothetical protein
LFQKIRSTNWFITWSNWEYWPWYIANIPVFFMVLWFALRARKLFFFSAVNPAIETGGVWGESKFEILESIPLSYRPTTLFFKKEMPFEKVLADMENAGQQFPLIAKPNVGERGFLVSKIESPEELSDYLAKNKVDFLLQDFLPGPLELSVLHYLPPGASSGATTSICIKNFLEVRGDGASTIRALMEKNPRAKLQVERFEKDFPNLLGQVPGQGEQVLLEPIGNHCRGTTFLNGNYLIDEQLMQIFDKVMAEMNDIHYGRFDLRCSSVAALKNGNFKVMEFNGIAAEPAHIYDPAIPVWKKYQVMWSHWNIIYRLYRTQQKRGKESMTLKEALKSYRKYSAYKKTAIQA